MRPCGENATAEPRAVSEPTAKRAATPFALRALGAARGFAPTPRKARLLLPRHPARAEAPGDCPRYAAPLRRRGRLDPLRPVGLWGRATSPAPGIRAPIRPLCAAQIIGCGSGKVAAYESGGASGTRVSLPFPPPLDPPSHPLTFVCGLTRGGREGERHTAGFFHVIGRPPFGEPDEQPPRLIPLAPSPRGAARWSRSRWHASKRRSRPPSPGSVDEARQLGGFALHAARLGRSAAPYRGHGPTTPRPPRLAACRSLA